MGVTFIQDEVSAGGAPSNGLLTGLKLWLPLNESGSVTRIDSHTGGYDFTVIGTVGSFSDATYGNVASFDGSTSNYLLNTTSGQWTNGDPVTFACWIYCTNVGNFGLFSKDNELLVRETGGSRAEFILNSFSSSDRVNSGFGVISASQWDLWIFEYDGTDMKIFVNDSEVGSVTPTGSYNTDYVNYIGRWSGEPYQGYMRNFAVWSKAGGLTSEEKTALYNAGSGLDYGDLD